MHFLTIFLIFIAITPHAEAAVKTCSASQLKSLNQLAIDYNTNRSYFLKFALSADRSIEGIRKSKLDRDSSGEAAWRENFSIAQEEAEKDQVIAISLEKKIRSLLAKCKSGYGIKYSADYGFLAMNKKVSGVRFPVFNIPVLSEDLLPIAPGSVLKLDEYFNRLAVSWFDPTARTVSIDCINDAPRTNVVKGLRALLAFSSYGSSLAAGTQWFPKSFTPPFASKIKTWESTSAPFLYLELDLVPGDGNPCGAKINNLPVLEKVGSDINYAGILLIDSTRAIAVVMNASKINGFWN